MKISALLPLAVAFFCISIAIFYRLLKIEKSTSFSWLCCITGLWQLSWFILFNSISEVTASSVATLGHYFIIPIPLIAYAYFSDILQTKKIRAKIYTLLTGFFLVCNCLGLISNGVNQFDFGFYPKAGVLHPYFLVLVALIMLDAFYIHIKKFKRPSLNKLNSRLLLFSFFIFCLSSLDFLVNYNFAFYPPGVIFITLFLFINLMNLVIIKQNSLNQINLDLDNRVKQQTNKILEMNKNTYKLAKSLSHDIRTPILGLKTSFELLNKEEFKNKEKFTQLFNMSLERIENMSSRLLKEKREMSIEKKAETMLTVVNMYDFLKKSKIEIETINPQFSGKVTIKFGNLERKISCLVDEENMFRVISNILNNSLETDIDNLLIEITSKIGNNCIAINIKDNGSGFPPNILECFRKNSYIHSSKVGGNGIGLISSKEKVVAMGGDMKIYNENGAVVAIELPIQNSKYLPHINLN